MKFARLLFCSAGAWGFLVLTPMYFMYSKVEVQSERKRDDDSSRRCAMSVERAVEQTRLDESPCGQAARGDGGAAPQEHIGQGRDPSEG
jgi:hypothetical protein